MSWLEKGRMEKREKPEKGRRNLPCPECIRYPDGSVRYKKSTLDEWAKKYENWDGSQW